MSDALMDWVSGAPTSSAPSALPTPTPTSPHGTPDALMQWASSDPIGGSAAKTTLAPNRPAPASHSTWESTADPISRYAVGGAEALAAGTFGLGTQAVSGLVGLGNMAKSYVTGGDHMQAFNDGANAVNDFAAKVPVAPETEAGKAILEKLGLVGDAIKAGGDYAYDKTGSPLIGAGVQAAGTLASLILPGKVGEATSMLREHIPQFAPSRTAIEASWGMDHTPVVAPADAVIPAHNDPVFNTPAGAMAFADGPMVHPTIDVPPVHAPADMGLLAKSDYPSPAGMSLSPQEFGPGSGLSMMPMEANSGLSLAPMQDHAPLSLMPREGYASDVAPTIADHGGLELTPKFSLEPQGEVAPNNPAASAFQPPTGFSLLPKGDEQVAPVIAPTLRAPTDFTLTPMDRTPMDRPVEATSATAAESPVVNTPTPLDRTPITAHSTSLVGPEEQARRAQILGDVGFQEAHSSALTADAAQAATVANMAKFTSHPAGQAAFDYFNKVKDTLASHLSNSIPGISSDEGFGLDQASLINKGKTFAAPSDAIRQYLDTRTKAAYLQADRDAGGLSAVKLDSFGKMLNTDSIFEGKAENQALRNGIRKYMSPKEQGIVDADGNIQPIRAQSAEGLRQYMNSQWTHESSGLIGKLKGKLDNDVFNSAGPDSAVYHDGRSIVQLKARTLDDPHGISKLMEVDPYNPMNRATSYEHMMGSAAKLSEAQLKHIIDTYRDPGLPPEIRAQGESAISALKSHYGDMMMKAGLETRGGNGRLHWNDAGIRKIGDDHSAILPTLFNKPGEMAKIQAVRDAGNILSVDPSYRGAAAQAHLALEQGIFSKYIGKIGQSAGGGLGYSIGHVPGAAVGAAVGEALGTALGKKVGEGGAVRSAQKAMVDIPSAASGAGLAAAKASSIQSVLTAAKEKAPGIIRGAASQAKAGTGIISGAMGRAIPYTPYVVTQPTKK